MNDPRPHLFTTELDDTLVKLAEKHPAEGKCLSLSNLIAEATHTKMTKLGSGSFGVTYKVGDNVVKYVNLKSRQITNDFILEATHWWDLQSRAHTIRDEITGLTLADFIPQFCWGSLYGTSGILYHLYEPVTDMKQYLNRPIPIPFQEGYTLFNALVVGLGLFHRAGYVHRDLKPANILIRKRDSPKASVPLFIDMGLVCRAPCSDRWRVGTRKYMPPDWLNAGNALRPPQRSIGQVRGHYASPFPFNAPPGVVTASVAERESAPPPRGNNKTLTFNTQRMNPFYSVATDNYAMSLILSELYEKIDWGDQQPEMEIAYGMIMSLRAAALGGLAARKQQYGQPLKPISNSKRRANREATQRRWKGISKNLLAHYALSNWSNRSAERKNWERAINEAARAEAAANAAVSALPRSATRKTKRARIGPGPSNVA